MSQQKQTATVVTDTAARRRTVHGVSLGILVLDTGFKRLPGDIAHAGTWPFPVQFSVVSGVTPADVIEGDSRDALEPFSKAIHQLVALGVDGITTSCGFLAAIHPQLKALSPVPIATSSLMQIPMVQQILPAGKTVGILASDKAALTDRHFSGIGVPNQFPVEELAADGPIRDNMRRNALDPDYGAQLDDALEAARRLVQQHPDVGAIVMECANLPPYSAALSQALQMPIYDIFTMATWFHGGLRPAHWVQSGA